MSLPSNSYLQSFEPYATIINFVIYIFAWFSKIIFAKLDCFLQVLSLLQIIWYKVKNKFNLTSLKKDKIV